jgi:hypothetical protein
MAYTNINKSSEHFNTKLWTGTGNNGNAISGVGFAPDLVWVKNRTNTYDHVLFDRVRGDNKHIESNNTSAEENEANTLAFGSDGYSVGTNTLNENNQSIVGWNWKANGQGSSNTDGSINTTYTSVNTTAGFSISKYVGNDTSGATVGHGLGVVPKMIIVKRLSGSAQNWVVYHQSLGNTDGLYLNTTDTTVGTNTFWNNTTPTSTVFTIGNSSKVNGGGGSDSYIAYCFAEKTGYSKFGSYIGNGNADGSFIYCGFKPTFVMVKQSTSSTDWFIVDNKRPEYNVVNKLLYPNGSYVEGTTNILDFTSQGFKLRSTDQTFNKDGNTFIYMAIGQSLVGTNGVTAKAR